MISPRIPEELMPTGLSEDDFETFVYEINIALASILTEYRDEVYGSRKHNSDATYMDGCLGPLCKQAHRQYARNRTGGKPSTYWAIFEPIQEWYGKQIEQKLDDLASHHETLARQKREELLDDCQDTVVNNMNTVPQKHS